MLGNGALGQLALGQFPDGGSVALLAEGLATAKGQGLLSGKSLLLVKSIGEAKGRAALVGATPLLTTVRGQGTGRLSSRGAVGLTAFARGIAKGQLGIAGALALRAATRGAAVGRSLFAGTVGIASLSRAAAFGRNLSSIVLSLRTVSKGSAGGQLGIIGKVGLHAVGKAAGMGRASISAIGALAALSASGAAAAFGRASLLIPIHLFTRGSAQGTSSVRPTPNVGLTSRTLGRGTGVSRFSLLANLVATARGQGIGRVSSQGSAALTALGKAAAFARNTLTAVVNLIALASTGKGATFGRAALFVPSTTVIGFDPRFICRADAWQVRVTVSTKPRPSFKRDPMPYGNDMSVIDPTIEQVTLTFNFAPWLASGVTITNVISIQVSVAAKSFAQDPNPSMIIFGNPQIVASPIIDNAPSVPAAAVLQQVANCQANVTYLLQCLVATSDNQKLNLATHLPCAVLN